MDGGAWRATIHGVAKSHPWWSFSSNLIILSSWTVYLQTSFIWKRHIPLSYLKWSHSVTSDSATPWTASSVHGILQVRVLGWGAISFSRGSSWPRYWTQVYLHYRQMLNPVIFKPLLFSYCCCFWVLILVLGLWDLSSPTRDWTQVLGNESTGLPGNSQATFILELVLV